MVKRICAAALAAALTLGQAAAAQEDIFTSRNIGAVLGGVSGALLGSQMGGGKGKLASVAAGTLLGAWLGSEMAQQLSPGDHTQANRAAARAFESGRAGQTIAWNNPDSGNSGAVTPQPAYQVSDGRYCREFTQTITVSGRREQAWGTACRRPDGTWETVRK